MIIIRYIGGLGNQLFQYAFAQELRHRGFKVYDDISDYNHYSRHQGFELLKVFDVDIKIAPADLLKKVKNDNSFVSKIKKRLFGYSKSSHLYQEQVDISKLLKENDYYLDGYWQKCISYQIKNELNELIRFRKPHLNDKNKELLEIIGKTACVGVHIRRGDYLNKENLKHFERLDEEYYNKAKSLVEEKIGRDVSYVFFSDDIEYVKATYRWGADNIFVDWNTGKDSYLDMYLMAQCKGLIMPNSTFSWWAGMLGRDNKEIIAPKFWWQEKSKDNDIYLPNEWSLINNRD